MERLSSNRRVGEIRYVPFCLVDVISELPINSAFGRTGLFDNDRSF